MQQVMMNVSVGPKKRRRKGRFGRRVLIFCFLFILFYTAWVMWEQHRTGMEPAPTLTQWVYTFFGVEVALLCLKRIFAKHDYKKQEGDNQNV